MRKEAALKMWWELYEAACRIEELKPWEYLTKDQYVVIQLKDEKRTDAFLPISLENGPGRGKRDPDLSWLQRMSHEPRRNTSHR